MIADMHCHVDLYEDYLRTAQEASKAQMWILAVTTTPAAWKGTCSRLRSFANIQVAIGLHPELAVSRADELSLLESLVGNAPFVGEVGLDGSPQHRQHLNIQEKVFKHILHCCQKAGGKVLSIHSRRAASQVLACVKEHRECGIPILHWFTGSKAELETAKRLDCWYSIGPQVFLNSWGMERVSFMPRNRILLETDGPFGKINDRVLQPADVYQAIATLARIWRVSPDDARQQIESNQEEVWRFAKIAI